MANTFKVKTKTNIGTADSDVYTCPSATATTVIGLNLANTTSSAVTADITLVNNDGDNVKIVKFCSNLLISDIYLSSIISLIII